MDYLTQLEMSQKFKIEKPKNFVEQLSKSVLTNLKSFSFYLHYNNFSSIIYSRFSFYLLY